MLLSFEDLAAMAARASSPPERLGADYCLETTDPQVLERRLGRLVKLRAGGDREAFQRVLEQTGESAERLSASLGNARWKDPARLPEWIDWLQRLIGSIPRHGSDADRRFIDPNSPLPFEEILSPLVLASRELLRSRCGTAYNQPAGTVHAALERMLLGWLTRLSETALLTEFSLYRIRFRHLTAESAAYRQFVSEFAGAHGRAFLIEYAVLTRLIATATKNWVEFASEFLTRTAADLPVIADTFLSGHDPGRLADIETGLSDPHRGSRSAMAVTFSSGLRLIYKPRDLRSMAAFFDIVQWLNGAGVRPPLAAARALDRGSHGWAEYIEYRPRSTPGEVLDFFERSGMLLRLLDLLETTDVHRENLISRGPDPILVDTETLLSPRVFSPAEQAVSDWVETKLTRKFRDSLLRTALLPQWSVEAGIVADSSALGGFEPERALLAVRRNTNTDEMASEYAAGTLPLAANVPFAGETASLSLQHAQAVERGFAAMDRFLTEHRGELQGDASPLAALAELRPRFVFRGTSIYFQVLRQSMSAGVLRDGADRWIELHALAKPLHVSTDALRYAALVRAEQEALWSLDIPLFLVTPDGDIEGVDLSPPDLFEATGYARLRDNVDRLGRGGLAEPLNMIRQSFCARLALPPSDRWEGGAPQYETVDLQHSISLATSLGADLLARAIRGDDGSLGWASLNYLPAAKRYRYFPAALGLADGAAGIALFLAGLWRTTEDRAWQRAALETLCPVRRVLRHAGTQVQNLAWAQGVRKVLGAGAGLGGIVYSLAHLSRLLEDETLLDDARLAAEMIGPELIRADRSFSLHDGAAGAAMGLIALHRIAGGDHLLDRIDLCGRHLLEHRCRAGVWKSQDGQPARGYAMGSAGIAAALCRISWISGNASYADAAMEALRNEASHCEGLTWAHGAAGVGIALSERTDEFREVIGKLSSEVLNAPLAAVDSPWFGTFGEAGFVNTRAAAAIGRARECGSFRLFAGGLDPAWSAGMYHGVSGIGYALLRLAEPRTLPAVLSFE